MLGEKISIYKEMYYFELDRKSKIHSDLSLLVVMVLAMAGSINFFFHNILSFNKYLWLQLIYFISIIGLFVCTCYAILYIIKTIYKYTYGYLPKAGEINKYFQELSLYYKEINEENLIEFEFANFLINELCKYTDMNTENNERKLHYVHKAKTAIIRGIGFIIISSILYAISYITPIFHAMCNFF